jgi:hypothetical protein
MANVKGSAVLARIQYVKEFFGDAGYGKLRAAMRPEFAARIDDVLLASEWVPLELFVDLNVQADRLFGTGDLGLCAKMAAYGAEKNLRTLYRIFFRLGSVGFILKKAAQLWDAHYDSGKLVTEEAGPKKVVLRIENFESPHCAHCKSVWGWATKSVELTGSRVEESKETGCRRRGSAACTMECRYI